MPSSRLGLQDFFVQSERMVEKATIFERDGKERKIAQLTSSILNFTRIFVIVMNDIVMLGE